LERGGKRELAVFDALGLGLKRRRAGYAQLGFAQYLFEAATDFIVNDVVTDAGPMTALDDGKGRVAWPKALNLGATRDPYPLGLYFLLDVGKRNDQINTALKAGQFFNHGLHSGPIYVWY